MCRKVSSAIFSSSSIQVPGPLFHSRGTRDWIEVESNIPPNTSMGVGSILIDTSSLWEEPSFYAFAILASAALIFILRRLRPKKPVTLGFYVVM